MENDLGSPRIRFFNAGDGTEISVSSLRVVLPSNLSFNIDAEPGRGHSAVFTFAPGHPGDEIFRYFSIEPGASNFFSVNITEAQRRKDDQD